MTTDLFGVDVPAMIKRGPRVHPNPMRVLPREDAKRQTVACGFPQRAVDVAYGLGADTGPEWATLTSAVKRGGVTLLYGPRGTGKTVTAARLGIVWHKRGYIVLGSARYWRLSDLLGEQKEHFGRRADPEYSRQSPVSIAGGAGLLVLDEVDETTESDFDITELTRIVDRRYAEYQPTLLISNRPPKDLHSRLGGSILDRIREGGAFVEFKGTSRRGEG